MENELAITASTYQGYKTSIRVSLNSAADDFFNIGYYLRQINESRAYQYDGYASIWDFAKAEYNLSQSSASRFMAINERFSIDNGTKMDEKYIGMGPSKLQEMLTLPDEDLERVTPQTTVKEIREMKKEAKEAVELSDREILDLYHELIECSNTWGDTPMLRDITASDLKEKYRGCGQTTKGLAWSGFSSFIRVNGKEITWAKLAEYMREADESKFIMQGDEPDATSQEEPAAEEQQDPEEDMDQVIIIDYEEITVRSLLKESQDLLAEYIGAEVPFTMIRERKILVDALALLDEKMLREGK